MQEQFYHTLATAQATHWWYSARRTLLKHILTTELECGIPDGPLYDLGCGVGCNLETLAKFRPTIGIDPSTEAVTLCRKLCGENNNISILQSSAEAVLSIGTPDPGIVVLTDVLEHVKEDGECIKNISMRLPPDGLLIITVPAFEFLWGPSDVTSHHFRRYRKPQLKALVEPYFSVKLLTYFNTFLFPPILVGRVFERIFNRPGDEGAGVPPPWLNRTLQTIMEAEIPLIKCGVLPFGVSLLAVLRKRA